MARRSEYKVLNMRVTPVARKLFAELAEHMGVSQTAAFETLVRKAAREEGLLPLPAAEPIDWSKYPEPTLEQFRNALKDIEAAAPLGPSIPDEALTSDALYADHD
ncbi:MAG: hypothetical protein P4L33_09605 [Capsulimonadaceae bacterium]|nr:hypothetical protein [Capsulimonadaceae bacterium]